MGMAFVTTLRPDESFTTMSLTINFFRPVWEARLRWETHLPDNCGRSHRTRETKVETHTESAWLIPSWNSS